MNNIFYDMYLKAQQEKDWFLYKAKASETNLVDKEELDAAFKVMGAATYNQEFECSFIGNVPGSIYGDLISDLEDKKLCEVKNSGIYITVEKPEWKKSLDSALQFYIDREEYEVCAKLVNKVPELRQY